MKRFGLAIFFIFLAAHLSAQTWTRMQGWGLDISAITWIDNQLAVAGGENLLIETADGGQTWKEASVEFEGHIRSIEIAGNSQGFAVGSDGLIFRTTNKGQTWEPHKIAFSDNWIQVLFNGEGTWLLIGESGLVIRSVDFGENWEDISPSPKKELFGGDFINTDSLFLVGSQGTILRSWDQGEAYEIQNSGINSNLYGIAFSSKNIGYAVGESGVVLKTLDFGETWTALISGVTKTLRKLKISPLDPRIITIVGDQASALRSTNEGATFSIANLGSGNERNLSDLAYIPNTNTVWAVGQIGYVISSANAGATYSHRQAGQAIDFLEVDFKTDRYGLIAGEEGQFFVTSNFAQSIVSRPIPENSTIRGLSFWNGSFGYVSTGSSKIYRSTNAGGTWLDVTPVENNIVNGFYLFAPSVFYVAGNEGFVASSFNSGDSWNDLPTTETNQNLKAVMFFDFVSGIAVGEGGEISFSAGGIEWFSQDSPTSEDLNALAKLSDSIAVVVGNKGVILKTEDQAATWRIIDTGITEDLLSVDFFDNQYGFISGRNGLTLATKDGGESWEKIESGTSRDLHSISVGTPLVAYAVGDDGTILRYNCFPPEGSLSEIEGPVQTCLQNQTYRIEDTPVAGSSIVWRVDGGEIINGQGTSQIEVQWLDPGRKGVFVSRQNFCGTGETSYIEVIVSDLPPETLQIEGQGTTCVNQTETYTLPALEGVSYNWSVNGGEIVSGQGTATVEILWNSPGLTELFAVPQNSCGTNPPVRLPIQVNASPERPSEIVGESIVPPGEFIYEVEEVEGLTYQWSIDSGGRILAGQGSPQVTVLWEEEGEYSLRVAAQNACDFGPEQELAVQVSFITGLEPTPDLTGLKIYPNPSTGKIYIEAEFLDQWNAVELLSSQGQALIQNEISTGMRRLEITDLKPGLYFIRLLGTRGSAVKKILVH
ncbi:MAG: T9SS type A sorting domain-containing protein [Algoriphagus sp.]|uniref:YCF48-related protein n=1 Tax=Algoriphagus sp. TaxID=1872435 RepID=UPI0018532001|nr:YCF48-related protein [Algoriphagus sp.]NVJ86577.1 T9SS type A sorting domain-containing protein [Algoriphagus sp.]